MFPIRDHNPSLATPLVAWALIAANVAVLLYQFAIGQSELDAALFYDRWALVPARLVAGDRTGLFSSMFLHAGILHCAGNMLFLWIFGDNMEDQMGHLGFLAFYLAAGAAAGLGQVLADPHSTVPMVGASGAIAGVMGGYLLLFPRARVDVLVILIVFFRIFPVPAWIVLGVWLGFQLAGGLGTEAGEGGVAYWAHAGGFAAGLLLTIPIWARRGGPAFWRRTHGLPPHPGTALSPSIIPIVRRRR